MSKPRTPVGRRRLVAVVGPADIAGDIAGDVAGDIAGDARAASDSSSEYAIARAVGRRLAEAGLAVVTGGLGGVMEAASRGADEAGGVALGLLPGTDADEGNPYLTLACATGLGELRNALLARACEAMVVVGGSWGTEAELALAVRLGKPVIAVGGWLRYEADGTQVRGVVAVADASAAVAAVRAAFDALDADVATVR